MNKGQFIDKMHEKSGLTVKDAERAETLRQASPSRFPLPRHLNSKQARPSRMLSTAEKLPGLDNETARCRQAAGCIRNIEKRQSSEMLRKQAGYAT